MEPIEALVAQRNTLAARCLDLELEIVYRDKRIAELEAAALDAATETEDQE